MESIAFDMDGVMVDLDRHVLQRYNETFDDDVKNAGGWNYPACKKTTTDWFHDLFRDPYTFLNAPPMEGAIETLYRLNKKYNLFIATICPPTAIWGKTEWVKKHMPFITKTIVLLRTPGQHLDKSSIKADYLVDDHVANLLSFKGEPVCFGDYAYNQEWRRARCKDFKEVERFFMKRERVK